MRREVSTQTSGRASGCPGARTPRGRARAAARALDAQPRELLDRHVGPCGCCSGGSSLLGGVLRARGCSFALGHRLERPRVLRRARRRHSGAGAAAHRHGRRARRRRVTPSAAAAPRVAQSDRRSDLQLRLLIILDQLVEGVHAAGAGAPDLSGRTCRTLRRPTGPESSAFRAHVGRCHGGCSARGRRAGCSARGRG